jgi:predicted amidohydrolase YtcJ
MARMKAAGVYPAPQPIFIYDFGDLYYSVVGTERADASYPMRGWINAGLKPSASTDAPVCDADPFPNIYTMLTRKTGKGTVLGGQEALAIDEVLQAYTEFGAFAEKAEAKKGRLVPGLLGDVAVFSRDMTKATPEQILEDTHCDLTIRGGEIIFDRLGEMR